MESRQASEAVSIRQPLLSQDHLESISHSSLETAQLLGRSPRRSYKRRPSGQLDSRFLREQSTETEPELVLEVDPSTEAQKDESISAQATDKERLPHWVLRQFRRALSWPRQALRAVRTDVKNTTLACKVGFTCALASLLVIIQPLDSLFYDVGIWAVITTALVYEGSIGASLSKGLNRVIGTFLAGAAAVLINHLGPFTGAFQPYFTVLCIFLITAIPTFLRYRPPLKEHWNYGLSMAIITGHLLILSGYKQEEEKFEKPVLRFAMIVFGFLLAALVNLGIKPAYAGDSLHALVAKNFGLAADVLERCTKEYIKGTALSHVPDILVGRQEDDKIHHMYHDIVMSDSEVDRLMSNVAWEPSHGPFFRGYPWDLYDDITDNLRYTVYTIIALDSSLRAEIQAQRELRAIFAPEMESISREAAALLRALALSMKEFKSVSVDKLLQRAEEAALALQFKLHNNAHLLLMDHGYGSQQSDVSSHEVSEDNSGHPVATVNSEEGANSPTEGPVTPGSVRGGLNAALATRRDQLSSTMAASALTDCQAEVKGRRGLSKGQAGIEQPWQREFTRRRGSLGRHWEGTLERISALSLVKYASLLIELVAGLKFVVESMEVLGARARFRVLKDRTNDKV